MPPVATTTRSTSSRVASSTRAASPAARDRAERQVRGAAACSSSERPVRAGRERRAWPRNAPGWRARGPRRVWVRPMEPVDRRLRRPGRARAPRRAQARRATTYSVTTGAANRNESTRSSIPPWPGIERAGVLGAGGALEHRLGEVAGLRGERGQRPEQERVERRLAEPAQQERDDDGRRHDAADRGRRTSSTARCGSGTARARTGGRRGTRRCRTTRPPGSAAGSSRVPRRATSSGAPSGTAGAAWPSRTTKASRLTYSAPKTVAIQVARPVARVGLRERGHGDEDDPDRDQEQAAALEHVRERGVEDDA